MVAVRSERVVVDDVVTGVVDPVRLVGSDPETGAVNPLSWSEDRWLLYDLESLSRGQRVLGCRELIAAVGWADLHPGEAVPVRRVGGGERGCRFGGVGTPLVAEFAVAEFAVELGHISWWGQRLIGDGLDLRHRLPVLWGRVVGCEVEAWQVRKIAQATRPLTVVQAGQVDAEIAESVGMLPWSRMEALVDAAVIRADPDRAARLAEAARSGQKAFVGQSDELGQAVVFARVEAADAIWLAAQVDRIARLLETLRSDRRSMDERRASALGLLARPLEVLRLFAEANDKAERDKAQHPATDHDDVEPDDTDHDPADPDDADDMPGQTPHGPSGVPSDGGPSDTDPGAESEADEVRWEGQVPWDQWDDPEPPEPEAPEPVLSDAVIEAAVRRLDPAMIAPPVVLYVHAAFEPSPLVPGQSGSRTSAR